MYEAVTRRKGGRIQLEEPPVVLKGTAKWEEDSNDHCHYGHDMRPSMPLLLLISTSHTSHEILSDVQILSLRASLENTTEEGVPELTFGLGPMARHQEYVEVVMVQLQRSQWVARRWYKWGRPANEVTQIQ